MDLSQNQLQRLIAIAKDRLEADCSCHDWDHTRRVLNTALALGRQENADSSVLTAAAVLHDIARPQEMADQGKTDHAVLGARQAAEILRQEDIGDDVWRDHVTACIRTHRYRNRSGEIPASIEARVLYDADKLDSLGAIGLARAFHFAGKTGARVHNSREEALSGQSYGREDSALREYLVKLQYLPDAMLTAAGKRAAQSRHQFMVEFFQQLDQECFGKSGLV